MLHRLIVIGTVAVTLASASCTHSGASANETVKPESSIYVEPRMAGGSGPVSISFQSRGRPFRGTIEIPIDSTGVAEVNSIHVIGTMDDLMKRSLQEWLDQVKFIPAKRDGIPVRGVFTMTFR